MTDPILYTIEILNKVIAAAIFFFALTDPAFSMNYCDSEKAINQNLYKLIDDVIKNHPDSVVAMQEIIGVKLNLVSEDIFRRYEARSVYIRSMPIDLVDYREPPSDGTDGSGPFLQFKFGKGCATKRKIYHRFKKLEFVGVPFDNNTDDQIYYSQAMPWGKIGFGFFSKSPNYLRSLTFQFRLR